MCFKIQSVTSTVDLSLAAFTHYVYKINDHKRLVADLQGAGEYLTDPLILDVKNAWVEETNTAQEGIEKFKKDHQCYSLCRDLGLPLLPGRSLNHEHEIIHEEDMIAQAKSKGHDYDHDARKYSFADIFSSIPSEQPAEDDWGKRLRPKKKT
ncbi:uncharacterized protein MELLADRAFT_87495 [Melampsora larici-populina 98AG31]|uniref:Alpha-type protein kinase domain-containing protein n=1 Tax=Melampsora larici-populina (strain 98AG31 / pathotype 3-4-7) TaxID=747676 RepID=F4RNI8_MELLP|nr:uncharacterized protein MELLADRAFT_87495 [Melampsora larici-populina 98AG31]EGG06088.1 hypothetical protein MELLADRAFT_87495 [Melampsora larici-populina 98AG31]